MLIRRAGICCALASVLAVSAFASRHQWAKGRELASASPGAVGGDEPHYLVVVNALLWGTLEVGPFYDNAFKGGGELGAFKRRSWIDHHTIVADRERQHHLLWRDAYDTRRPIACGPRCARFQPKATVQWIDATSVELPAHPIGFPLLLAAGTLPFRGDALEVEKRAVDVVLLLSWLGVIATYLAGRRAGLSTSFALAASLLVGLASPWLPYSRSLFSETAGGLVLVLALWAMLAGWPAAAALAIVAAALIKPALGLVALGFAAFLLLERRGKDAIIFGALTAAGGLAIVGFNHWLAGTMLIGGNRAFVPARRLSTFFNVFIGTQHGLLPFTPWAALGLVALVLAWRRKGQAPALGTLQRLLALGTLCYLAVLLGSAFGSGGFSYGPRLLVSFLPYLALAAAAWAQQRGTVLRAALLALGLSGAAIAVPAALDYPNQFEQTPLRPYQK